MEDDIRNIFNGYLDQIVERGEADLVEEVTSPFPMDVISAFLDIPEVTVPSYDPTQHNLIREDGKMELPQVAAEGMFAMLQYFLDDLPKRRKNPRTALMTISSLSKLMDGHSPKNFLATAAFVIMGMKQQQRWSQTPLTSSQDT